MSEVRMSIYKSFCVSCLLLAWGTTQASSFSVVGVKGFIVLDWFQAFQTNDFVIYGGSEGVLENAVVSGQLDVEFRDFKLGFTMKNLGLDRQGLKFQVTHRNVVGLVTFDNTPPPPESDARKLNFLGALSLSFENIPEVAVTYVRNVQEGGNGFILSTLELEVDDRYKKVTPFLPELRWKLGYGLETSEFKINSIGDETQHRFSTRLKAKIVTGEGGIEFAPEARAELTYTSPEDSDSSLEQEYSLGTKILLTKTETIETGFSLDLKTDKEPENEENLSFSTTRFAPLAFTTSVSRKGEEEGQLFTWGLDADYNVSQELKIGSFYSGSTGLGNLRHVLGANVAYNEQPWFAQLSASTGLQKNEGEDFKPNMRFVGSLNYRSQNDLSIGIRGNLQYQAELFTSSFDVTGSYQIEPLDISASGGILYSQDFSARLNLDTFYNVFDDISLHFTAGYRTNLSTDDSNITLGAGLRYDFGGSSK